MGAIEKKATMKPRLTPATLAVVAMMNLVDCMNMNLLTPYAAAMVSTFEHRQRDDDSVLHHVGVLIGLYNISEMIFSPLWGWLSDRFGRRAVLLIGLAGTAATAILFGLSSSMPTAFLFRALAGIMCGNFGVTKTYLAELVDETNEARAFSFLAAMYSVGMFLGPLVGGCTVFPADRAPSLFRGTVFETKPFLMPNVCFAAFCVVVWLLAACCLEETLPREKRASACGRRSARSPSARRAEDEKEETGAAACCRFTSCSPLGEAPPGLWRMVLSYGLAFAYLIASTQTFVLVVQIGRDREGFGLSPAEIAMLQNCAAVGLLLTQLLLYPWLVQKKGYRFCITLGLFTVMAVSFPFPLYGLMADPDKFGAWRMVPLGCMMLVQQSALGLCIPTITVWVNRLSDGLDRGTINGWTNAFAGLCRALSPELCSSLLGLGLHSGLPSGRYLPIYVTALLAVAVLLLARPVLPRGPPTAAAPAKAASDAEGARRQRSRRAVTWRRDRDAAAQGLKEEDLEAGAPRRSKTWWPGQESAAEAAVTAAVSACNEQEESQLDRSTTA